MGTLTTSPQNCAEEPAAAATKVRGTPATRNRRCRIARAGGKSLGTWKGLRSEQWKEMWAEFSQKSLRSLRRRCDVTNFEEQGSYVERVSGVIRL